MVIKKLNFIVIIVACHLLWMLRHLIVAVEKVLHFHLDYLIVDAHLQLNKESFFISFWMFIVDP